MCRYPVGATLREALASVPASAPLVHLRNREVAKTNGRYIFDSSYNFFRRRTPRLGMNGRASRERALLPL